MKIKVFIHTKNHYIEINTLIDCRAIENFMNSDYARYLGLPCHRMETPRRVFNVDRTENKEGKLTHYTDLQLQAGKKSWIH